MDRKIQDYIRFYLGGQILQHSSGENIICTIVNVSVNGAYVTGTSKDGKSFNSYGNQEGGKLILRPLSDMTEEECKFLTGYNKFENIRELIKFEKEDKLAILDYRWKDGRIGTEDGYAYSSTAIYFDKKEWTAEQFQYLLSHGFDLFNLIPDKFAIDKTTLTTQQG